MNIPKDFAVQPLGPDENPEGRTTCHTCGLSWDDDIGTTWTPAPGGRCPFEYFHEYEEDDQDEDENPKIEKVKREVEIAVGYADYLWGSFKAETTATDEELKDFNVLNEIIEDQLEVDEKEVIFTILLWAEPIKVTPTLPENLELPLPKGGTLICHKGIDHLYGSAVTVLDKDGNECAHWSLNEWESEPEQVMGTIIRCACGK